MCKSKKNSLTADRNPAEAVEEICFGLDRETDERSLAALLHAFSQPEFLGLLTPRLKGGEIDELVDHIFRLLRKHLSHNEYHRFF